MAPEVKLTREKLDRITEYVTNNFEELSTPSKDKTKIIDYNTFLNYMF